VFAPSKLSPRSRRRAAAVIHRAWRWLSEVGGVSPDDAAGQRFAAMGPGSYIAFPPGAVFGEGRVSIGTGSLLGPQVTLSAGMPLETVAQDAPPVVRIGDRVSIGRGSSIVGRCSIDIEDDVTTGPNVYITDHNHSYADVKVPIGVQWVAEDAVRIGAGSWLGAGVVVLPGANIGRHVTVAANSVVRGVVPDRSVVAGAPARIVRRHVDGDGWVPPIRTPNNTAPEGWAGLIASLDRAYR
jgi:acetyltransferase-like isoleucine patch superfamily enzyme